MLTTLYYLLKPILPRSMRIRARQLRAEYLLPKHSSTWPIDSDAGAPPPNWPGWPHGKKFAFVLTHDVEDTIGVRRIPDLLALDKRFGLSASFNLIAQGTYSVSPALLDHIASNQFEIGVHGLKHDGKLYHSKLEFLARATEIRRSMRNWKSVGFRSPLMQHRLNWLHLLGCEYDSSTFDTDPFEPQSDGVKTIFPFWVPADNSTGFVELPYTLAQDFTLFTILRKQDISLWTQKLDWIAEHGGMALLNVHPDYISFDGRPARGEFPYTYYEDFLRYVTERYRGQYWSALPRDVARYYCDSMPQHLRNTRRKVCMVAYTQYECDNRVRRYAETLARRGDSVDAIALASTTTSEASSRLKGVTVHHVQKRDYTERSPFAFAAFHLLFLLRSAWTLRRLHQANRYDVIHVHNLPDYLVFSAIFPKLDGARIILDIHDLMPELFADKFAGHMQEHYLRVLRLAERLSANFADHLIVSNHLWCDTVMHRSVSPDRCSVFLNHVDPEIFFPRKRTRHQDPFIVMFPGTFQPHQGLDVGIEAFAHFHAAVPNSEFHLYGGGNPTIESQLRNQAKSLGLEQSVKFLGVASLDRMPDVISNADLGLVPKRADSFGNEAYSTKIMEFLSQGVPVVASRTRIDSYYFKEGTVHFCESGNPVSMAKAMLDVFGNSRLRTDLISNGLEYVGRNGWQTKKDDYLALIDSLSTERFPGQGRFTPPARSLAHIDDGAA